MTAPNMRAAVMALMSARAAIDAALEALGVGAEDAPQGDGGCQHKNFDDLSGFGKGPKRRRCRDCKEEWAE